MRRSRYKDFLATTILLGIIGAITGFYLFVTYASAQSKTYFIQAMMGLLVCVGVGVIWFLIRQIID